MKTTLAFLATLFLLSASPSTVRAEEGHSGVGTITGEGIELKIHDHAIAGSMKGFVLFGNVDEQKGVADLTMKRDGQLVTATFGRKDGKLGGTIQHTVDDTTMTTSIYFTKVDQQNKTLYLSVNGEELQLAISSEGFENNHFINPTYRTHFRGKDLSYSVKGSRACYRMSLNLAFMVLGAYLH